MTVITFARNFDGFDIGAVDTSEWQETAGSTFSRTYEVQGYTLTVVGDFMTASGMPDDDARIFAFELRNSSGDLEYRKSGFNIEFRHVGNPTGAFTGHDQPLIYSGSDIVDEVYDTSNDDTISTFGGADTIYLGFGKDIVDAGDGDDRIHLAGGEATVTSGDGEDIFVFDDYTTLRDTRYRHPEGPDVLTDFEHGVDLLDLHHIRKVWVSTGVFEGHDAKVAWDFIGKGRFSGHNGEVRYTQTRDDDYGKITQIQFEADKTHKGYDFELILQGHVRLTDADFFL